MDTTSFFKQTEQFLAGRSFSASSMAGWELIEKQIRGNQALYERDAAGGIRRHQDRMVREASYSLTLYTRSDDAMGMASGNLLPWLPFDRQIDELLDVAAQGRNKPWRLAAPPAQPYPQVSTCDQNIGGQPDPVLQEIEQQIVDAIRQHDDIAVNSTEIFLNVHDISRVSGTGIRTSKQISEVYIEVAMERAGQDNDKEVLETITGVSSADVDIPAFIALCAEQVRSLGQTREPDTTEEICVVIDKNALAAILDAVRSQLDAAMEYHKMPHFKPGASVYGDVEPRDRLTMTLDPGIPYMVESTPHTDEGLVAEKRVVIDQGRVVDRMISNRYGQYLDLAPNGVTGNIVVPSGSVSHRDFINHVPSYIEILKFSSLLVDERKLTWSSEIKLARQVDHSGQTALLKGGVVSGKIVDNLAACLFSSETGRVNRPSNGFDNGVGYEGPAKVLIMKGVSVAGR